MSAFVSDLREALERPAHRTTSTRPVRRSPAKGAEAPQGRLTLDEATEAKLSTIVRRAAS